MSPQTTIMRKCAHEKWVDLENDEAKNPGRTVRRCAACHMKETRWRQAGSVKEQRDKFMADLGVVESSPQAQLFLIRALLGLNPDQETVEGVRLLMTHTREKFVELRGPRYDVLNNRFETADCRSHLP